MAPPTLPRKAGQRPPARQQVTVRMEGGGLVRPIVSGVSGALDRAFQRSSSEPVKTVSAYKLFRQKGDDLYPLFVDAKVPVPREEWIDAQAGPMVGDKVKSSLGPLAYRPGWHAGDLPIAAHIGGKYPPNAKAPTYRPDEQVWAEVLMPDDVDWQAEALARAARTKEGVIIPRTAHITDQVPAGGHYRYKTNPNMTGEWLIGGSMKVGKTLADDEVRAVNEAAGVSDLPRLQEYLRSLKGQKYAEGGVVEEAPANDDIRAYESLRSRVARQPPDIQSMTHVGDRPQRPVQIQGGLIGKQTLGSADYDRAGALSSLLQAGYDAKTLPLYFTPAAPIAASADMAEGMASGDPLQAGMGALGAPGRAAKAVGMAGAALMPSDAEAAFYSWRSPLVSRSGALTRSFDAAQDMASRGVPRQEINRATGWFKSKDNQWRWEGSDDQMGFAGRFLGTKRAADVVSHPHMFEAAPELADLPVRYERMADGPAGYFTERGRNAAPEIVLNADYDKRFMPSILLHELQHGIQHTQGLNPGGTAENIAAFKLKPDLERGIQLIEKREQAGLGGGLSRDEMNDLAITRGAADRLLNPELRADYYDNSLGEAEARLVQDRMHLRPEQRPGSIPFQNYRSFRPHGMLIPESELITHPSPTTMAAEADVDRLMAYARKLKAYGSP